MQYRVTMTEVATYSKVIDLTEDEYNSLRHSFENDLCLLDIGDANLTHDDTIAYEVTEAEIEAVAQVKSTGANCDQDTKNQDEN